MSPWIDEPKRRRHLDLDVQRADYPDADIGTAATPNHIKVEVYVHH